MLQPVFDREHGLKGRISIQTNPIFYRNADAIVAANPPLSYTRTKYAGQDSSDRGGYQSD